MELCSRYENLIISLRHNGGDEIFEIWLPLETCQTYIRCFKTSDKRIGQSFNLSILLNMQSWQRWRLSCKRQNGVFPCKEQRGLAKGKVLTKNQHYLQKANKEEILWGILLGLFTGILVLLRKPWIHLTLNMHAPLWRVNYDIILCMQNVNVYGISMYAWAVGGMQICGLWIVPSIIGLCGTFYFDG